jgi:hypothetical protein
VRAGDLLERGTHLAHLERNAAAIREGAGDRDMRLLRDLTSEERVRFVLAADETLRASGSCRVCTTLRLTP